MIPLWTRRYQVDKFLRDVNHHEALASRWREETEAAFDGYDLTAAEREALKGWEVRRLYEMGANPLLLLLSSMAAGKSIGGYVELMRGKP
jgi:hypothetical protein